MFPYYQGADHLKQLPYDDMVGITQLYGYKHMLNPQYPYYPQVPYTPERTTSHPQDPHYPTYPTDPTTNPTTSLAPRYPYSPRQPQTPPSTMSPTVPPTTRTFNVPMTTRKSYTTSTAEYSCEAGYDAISVIRGELFIFYGKKIWRLKEPGSMFEGYPTHVRYMWRDLPRDIDHIDAVYERPDETIAFFHKKRYWLFLGNDMLPGYPQPLTDLGLPEDVPKIDAAMTWAYNGKTYFFSGTMYWRFNEEQHRVEYDYPRDMKLWSGVPYNIQSAFQWTDKRTYFFKGQHYWLFDDTEMTVHEGYPRQSALDWLECTGEIKLTENQGTRAQSAFLRLICVALVFLISVKEM